MSMHVRRQDVLSILITFVMGVLVGAYLYVTGFAPRYSLPDVPPGTTYDSFVVTGVAYGQACEANGGVCPSFQILGSGDYTYRAYAPDRSEQRVYEDKLPASLMRSLFRHATADTLTVEAEAILPERPCLGETTGLDYRFWITRENEEYLLDTCGTALNQEGKLWEALVAVWDYFYEL